MVKLMARSPLDGLDETLGTTRLREVTVGPITSIAPGPGGEEALDKALLTAHGLGFPAPGDTLAAGDARIIWSGPGQAFLLGVAPDDALAGLAAMTEQSDGWAAMELSGAEAAAVLARLVAVDLRDSHFAVGATARCTLVHMNCSLTRLEDGAWLILVFRSMALSAAEEIRHAMAGVAARG